MSGAGHGECALPTLNRQTRLHRPGIEALGLVGLGLTTTGPRGNLQSAESGGVVFKPARRHSARSMSKTMSNYVKSDRSAGSFVRENWDDVGKLILRITIAFLLFFHGLGKLEHGIAWMRGPLSHFGLPFFIGYGVYVGEVLAPVLIFLGIFSRPAALAIVIDIVMAIVLIAHTRLFALSRGGAYGLQTEAFFLLLAVVVFFQGPGRYSISRGRGPWWL